MPYAPGINYDFSPLAAGLGQLGDNIKKFAEKKKQEKQENKSLEMLIPIYSPEHKDAVATMGLKEKRALAQSLVAKRVVMAQDQQRELTAAQMANMKADNTRADTSLLLQKEINAAHIKNFQTQADNQTADAQRANRKLGIDASLAEANMANLKADNERAGEFLNLQRAAAVAAAQKSAREVEEANSLRSSVRGLARDYAHPPFPAAALDKYVTHQGRINYALERNPEALLSPQATALMRWGAGGTGKNGAGGPPTYSEDPETGIRHAILGNTMQPSGINPTKLRANTVPLYDEHNKESDTHVLFYDAKGNARLLKKSDAKIKVDPIIGTTWTGTVKQQKEYLKQLEEQRNEPIPLPEDADEYEDKQVYDSPRGKVRFNAKTKKFTKVE